MEQQHSSSETTASRNKPKSLSGIETLAVARQNWQRQAEINLNPYQGLKPLNC